MAKSIQSNPGVDDFYLRFYGLQDKMVGMGYTEISDGLELDIYIFTLS